MIKKKKRKGNNESKQGKTEQNGIRGGRPNDLPLSSALSPSCLFFLPSFLPSSTEDEELPRVDRTNDPIRERARRSLAIRRLERKEDGEERREDRTRKEKEKRKERKDDSGENAESGNQTARKKGRAGKETKIGGQEAGRNDQCPSSHAGMVRVWRSSNWRERKEGQQGNEGQDRKETKQKVTRWGKEG